MGFNKMNKIMYLTGMKKRSSLKIKRKNEDEVWN